jgi:hypothetical protein
MWRSNYFFGGGGGVKIFDIWRDHKPPKKPPEPDSQPGTHRVPGYRYHDNQRCLCVQTKQAFQA